MGAGAWRCWSRPRPACSELELERTASGPTTSRTPSADLARGDGQRRGLAHCYMDALEGALDVPAQGRAGRLDTYFKKAPLPRSPSAADLPGAPHAAAPLPPLQEERGGGALRRRAPSRRSPSTGDGRDLLGEHLRRAEWGSSSRAATSKPATASASSPYGSGPCGEFHSGILGRERGGGWPAAGLRELCARAAALVEEYEALERSASGSSTPGTSSPRRKGFSHGLYAAQLRRPRVLLTFKGIKDYYREYRLGLRCGWLSTRGRSGAFGMTANGGERVLIDPPECRNRWHPG